MEGLEGNVCECGQDGSQHERFFKLDVKNLLELDEDL